MKLARSIGERSYEIDFLLRQAALEQDLEHSDALIDEARKVIDPDDPIMAAKLRLAQARRSLRAGGAGIEDARGHLEYFRSTPADTISPEIEIEYRFLRQALFDRVGDPAGALEEALKGIHAAERHGRTIDAFRLRMYSYIHYWRLEQHDKAIEESTACLEFLERHGLQRMLGRVANHVALFKLNSGDHEGALQALDHAERVADAEPSESFKVSRLRAAAANLAEKYDEAVVHANRAVALAQEHDNVDGEMDSRVERASARERMAATAEEGGTRQQLLNEAARDLEFCIANARKRGDQVRIKMYGEHLARVRGAQQRFRDAVALHREADAASESISKSRLTLGTERGEDAAQSQARLVESKEAEKRAQVVAKTEQERSRRVSVWLIVSVLISIVILVVVVVLIRRHRKLQKEHALTQELYSNQARLLRILGHDLRQPLSALVLFTDVAARQNDAEDSTVREGIRKSASSAASFASQLLGIALAHQGPGDRPVSAVSSVQLSRLFVDVIPFHESAAQLKGVDLSADGEDIVVQTSELAVRVIINNLLFNAIKFTDRGGKVTIGAERTGENAILRVDDTGAGMEETEIERVLGRSPAKQGPSKSGYGIGLALIKELVDGIGGALTIESTPGQGSTFKVSLPDIS